VFVSACTEEQIEYKDSPNTVVQETDPKDFEAIESNNDEVEISKCQVPQTNIDYIFKHLKPDMSKSDVVKLFGQPCAETYTLLYADYSVEWRYDFGQSINNYRSPYGSGDFSFVDEQGLKTGAIEAQVFIGWNENGTVKYAEVNYMKDGELITEMILPDGFLRANEFLVKTVCVNDKISGLTVESVEPFDQIQGAATIRFTGEIELSGTYKYYTENEKALEQYDLYLILDEQSVQSIPRVHHNLPDLPFVKLGVTNSANVLEQIERVGKEGRFKGTFTNYVIQFALFKPTEDTIQAKEIFLFADE
jgi:hypothetical protein